MVNAPDTEDAVEPATVSIAVGPLRGRAGSVADQRNRLEVRTERESTVLVLQKHGGRSADLTN